MPRRLGPIKNYRYAGTGDRRNRKMAKRHCTNCRYWTGKLEAPCMRDGWETLPKYTAWYQMGSAAPKAATARWRVCDGWCVPLISLEWYRGPTLGDPE